MKVIGIVGGMGAGKSTVISLMKDIMPVSYISADNIGHDILLKGHEAYQKVIDSFGEDILDNNGNIVRARLGEKVFKDKNRLMLLNSITHPLITEIIKNKIEYYKKSAPKRPVILEAALLVESGLISLTDTVVAIYADENQRVKRVAVRDSMEEKQILFRFKSQKKWEELKEVSDYVIDNSVSIEYTKKQIKEFMKSLLEEEVAK